MTQALAHCEENGGLSRREACVGALGVMFAASIGAGGSAASGGGGGGDAGAPGVQPAGREASRVRGPGLHHVGIFVADVERSVKFYTEGLGFRVAYRWANADGDRPGWEKAFSRPGVLLDVGDGNYFELFPSLGGAMVPPSFPLHHVAVRTPDIRAAYRRATAAGARPFALELEAGVWDGSPMELRLNGDPPRIIRIALVQGPDGELVELFENDVL